jgi:hypothetical protein
MAQVFIYKKLENLPAKVSKEDFYLLDNGRRQNSQRYLKQPW